MFDGKGGRLHLQNLKVYDVGNEEEALKLLFRGNMNRVTSETPMNMASSRSHCILSLTIESRHDDSAVVRRSKLHMVRQRSLPRWLAACSRRGGMVGRWIWLEASAPTNLWMLPTLPAMRAAISTCRFIT